MSTSQFPTGEAGLVNAQQMLLAHLSQTGTPQTGDGGIVNLQNLLQQFLAGGGGSGMVPPGSKGIGAFTTNGTSGLATFNPTTGALNIPNYSAVPAGSTGISALTTNGQSGPSSYSAGALNIPVYAAATLNMQKATVTTAYSANATTYATAPYIGLSISFTANVNPCVCLDYNFSITPTGASVVPAVGIVRTTGVPPPVSTPAPAGDTLLCQTRNIGFQNNAGNIGGTFLDTTLSVGTVYNYYVVTWVSAGTGSITISVSSITGLCAFEVK